ncbi:GPW/gp25 family protein [Chryseobacterium wanjuense]
MYYKIPIDFELVMHKKDAEKISIDNSIAQQIFLIATTSLGESKFDESFGSEIWEMDFDLLKSDNMVREFITNALHKAISMHEKRLQLSDVEVLVQDQSIGGSEKRE